MDAHQNARTTPHRRRLIVERLSEGWSVSAVATALGLDPKTVRKWRARFAAEGAAGLRDRSSRPHRSPTRLDARAEAEIARLRRERLSGPAIARQARRPLSTVGRVLRRLGLGRLAALDPKPPVRRYERERPGELIHIDTKKLGRIDGIGHRITGHRSGMRRNRGIGWDHLHVAVDDASRLAFTEILPDDRKASATGFLARALAFFESHGVVVERVMTDNGSAYRSGAFATAIQSAGLRHSRTRPYTPRTNGKAERFIQSSLREWACARPFTSSAERRQAMLPWIGRYNHSRPHAALGGQPPISRIAKDNLLGSDS
ncbi:IS481 family transposase [Methylobacterium planeticum]|uniref:IS481 family transposase n=1 Tax=Methylobacterium planeticum TaxID=2615211 RepID=A0A6N6MP81_9HYPH|nr:IS481 family transposase [Methylobacterium planeticum]KAB1073273.1 IS481 family transposase [Methylobacterium planeticum]